MQSKMSTPGKQQVSSVKSSGKSPAVSPPSGSKRDTEATKTAADTPAKEKSTSPKFSKEVITEEKIPSGKNPSFGSASSDAKVFEEVTQKFSGVPDTPISGSTKNPGQQKLDDQQQVNVAVPRQRVPLPIPSLNVRPLVLATHLVPSLPVGLFELVAEAVETATQLPVTLLYESRPERPVAKDVTDLAFLPTYSKWEDGDFLPVTFVFAHRLNDSGSGNVYVDVLVAADRAAYVKDIMDLRGHRCALPDRREPRGAAALLLRDLRARGESPAFFGNTLDSGSQIAALQMVAGKQAEVGVVEAPVLACHRRKLPGVSSLLNLGSLGPLPPYAFYVRKSVSDEVRQKISSYLLNLQNDEDWTDRFSQYGVIGFTKNSLDAYIVDEDDKEFATSVRYY